MAESILISLSSKILSTIASPVFKIAYEKGVSIWEAREDLVKLQVTIETLQSVIIDAEKKEEGSNSVKNWIKRLKGVLYDAEDLFDEVDADELLEEFMVEGCLEKQVWVFCSKLNPLVSRNSIAKRVKAIKERLDDICTSMDRLGFVQTQPILINVRKKTYDARVSIDGKSVIGREKDKTIILKLLFNELSNNPLVIAIEGIGGMGKTTLAHVIYNDEKVSAVFEKRWFACISNTSDEREILGKIYQSVSGKGYSDLTMFQLEDEIKKSIRGKKYLLVLDDVWDDHYGRWLTRKSLLNGGGKGSKIIVTTRLPSVGIAMGAIRAHNLEGLAEEDSWNLFKSLAFVSGYENDSRRESLGRELLKKCSGLPLAIWCMGSLLHDKTIREWEEIARVDLPTLRKNYNDETMSILKLSYDHLTSNLKQCFTYCCLFQKGYKYNKMDLIYHWISQRYINVDEGESSFMHLLRMGFFQDVEKDSFGEIESCKMHDIMHELALHLSGEEIIIQSDTSLNMSSGARYISLMVDAGEDGSWGIPMSILDVKSIRSFILRSLSYQCSLSNLDQLCSNLKLLRTLKLSYLNIEHIPPSIGELKLLRYLDLSGNKFEVLPDSITNLVNLLLLDLSNCEEIKVWPNNFKRLTKLWTLNFSCCYKLMSIPEGIGGIAGLHHLSHFDIRKKSELDVLNDLLKQLRDYLPIYFYEEMEVEDELNWQLPSDVSLQHLDISSYPGKRMRGWENSKCTSKLEHLELWNCKNLKYLPPFSHLPILKRLELKDLWELEYLEDEEEVNVYSNATSNRLFFPCLDVLILDSLPKLKGWRGKVAMEATSSSTSRASSFLEFSRLSKLYIYNSPKLTSFPRCPNLQEFEHIHRDDSYISPKIMQKLPSTKFFSYTYPSLQRLDIQNCCTLKKVHLTSPNIQSIKITECIELVSIELVGTPEPSLRHLIIEDCIQLKSLQIEGHLIAGLKEMIIIDCPELRLSKTQGKRLMVHQGLHEVETGILHLKGVDSNLVEQSLSSFSLSSLRDISIIECEGPVISLHGVALISLRQCQILCTNGINSLHIPSPHLESIFLDKCTGLASIEVEAATSIKIVDCRELTSLHIAHTDAIKVFRLTSTPPAVAGVDWGSIPNFGESTCVSSLHLKGVDGVFLERLLSSQLPSLQEIPVPKSIGSLTVEIKSLQDFTIGYVRGLRILNIKSHLRGLAIENCSELTNVRIFHPIALTRLRLLDCSELRLSTCVDWDALTSLKFLEINPLEPNEELPQCLLHRKSLGTLIVHALVT